MQSVGKNAFRVPDFRIYFFFQLFSWIWTQAHMFAQSIHVYQLTHSATLTGFTASLMTLPSIILSLAGGVLADRFGVKRIMRFDQVGCAIPAICLGVITLLHQTVWQEIVIVSAIIGLINSVDAVVRQTFIAQIVDQEQIQSATAAHSLIVQSSLFVGPPIAGLMMAMTNIGWVYLANGISFIGVLISLKLIRLRDVPSLEHGPMFQMAKEGMQYVISHTGLRLIFGIQFVVCFFTAGFRGIFPVIASQAFHAEGKQIAALASVFAAAAGVGAMAGTLLSGTSRSSRNPMLVSIGAMMTGMSLCGFFFIGNHSTMAFVLFFIAAAGFSVVGVLARTTTQRVVAKEMRARTMGILVAISFGSIGFGMLVTGWVAARYGPVLPMGIGGTVALLLGIILVASKPLREKIPQ